MITFRGTCPGCRQLSVVDLQTPCPNLLKDGRVCGFALTTSFASGNHKYRTKSEKHTAPPVSGNLADHSWTRSGLYDRHQAAVLTSGGLGYDQVHGYFCLTAPVNSGEATVMYCRSGTSEVATRIVMPLNSRWADLHLHYRANGSGLIQIATGGFVFESSGCVVSGMLRKTYGARQSGQLVAAYDPVHSGLVTFR